MKTHDFNLWLFRHTQRFPKHLRHTYTNRLESLALDFEEALLMGNAARGQVRSRWLERADGRLVCLRALLRYDVRPSGRRLSLPRRARSSW